MANKRDRKPITSHDLIRGNKLQVTYRTGLKLDAGVSLGVRVEDVGDMQYDLSVEFRADDLVTTVRLPGIFSLGRIWADCQVVTLGAVLRATDKDVMTEIIGHILNREGELQISRRGVPPMGCLQFVFRFRSLQIEASCPHEFLDPFFEIALEKSAG